MWDSGLLTFIQFSEGEEHARQAMGKRPERMLHGLAAEHHFERLDPVYASVINLLNDKNKVTYSKFFPDIYCCAFSGKLETQKDHVRKRQKLAVIRLRFSVQSLVETSTITMYSARKHEVSWKNRPCKSQFWNLKVEASATSASGNHHQRYTHYCLWSSWMQQ